MRINAEKKEERERVALSLMRATLALAATHGFSSLGLREVSRAAGIAPTSFYRHFADMEELGLELIESLVGRLARQLAEAPGSHERGNGADVIMNRALVATAEDRELFRFILAEHNGSIASFRKALRGQLGVVSRAILEAGASNKAPLRAEDCDAIILLLFDGCGELLEHGLERLPAVRARLSRQAQALFTVPSPPRGRQ